LGGGNDAMAACGDEEEARARVRVWSRRREGGAEAEVTSEVLESARKASGRVAISLLEARTCVDRLLQRDGQHTYADCKHEHVC
jgi:hypothetical protein